MNIAALVKVSEPAILAVYGTVPVHFVNVPGLWQTYDASVGWISPDGAYKIVNIIQFNLPLGQQLVGAPYYTIDAQLNVNELFDTIPLTPVPPQITYTDLINRMTDDEVLALQTQIATEPSLLRWDREAQQRQILLLSQPFVALGKTLFITKNIITIIRANQIFSEN